MPLAETEHPHRRADTYFYHATDAMGNGAPLTAIPHALIAIYFELHNIALMLDGIWTEMANRD